MSWVTGDSFWKTEPIVQPLDRERVLRDFKPFFLTQTSERSLKKTVKRDSGNKLCIGVPTEWWLTIRPRGELPELDGRDLRPLLPTTEWIVVLGVLQCQLSSHTSLYMAMGKDARMFVYSASEDALVLVANDMDEFSRIGLSLCEFVFRATCTITSMPQMAPEIWSDLLRCKTARELARCLMENRNDIIELKTPYKMESNPLKIIDKFDFFFFYWPFSAMDADRKKSVATYISKKLCARWHAFGLAGIFKSTGVFHALYMILFDDFGSLFYLSTATGEMARLANSVSDLYCLGLLKVFASGRRTDRDWVGISRLESPPDPTLWFHPRKNASHLCSDVAQPGEMQLSQQYAWLSCEGRSEIHSEEETVISDTVLRLHKLTPCVVQNGGIQLPVPSAVATSESPIRPFVRAMWRDDDAWRPQAHFTTDDAADMPPFRDSAILHSVDSYYSLIDGSLESVMKRRVIANSLVTTPGIFHAPIVEAPKNTSQYDECCACKNDMTHKTVPPPVPPPTPAPRRRRLAGENKDDTAM